METGKNRHMEVHQIWSNLWMSKTMVIEGRIGGPLPKPYTETPRIQEPISNLCGFQFQINTWTQDYQLLSRNDDVNREVLLVVSKSQSLRTTCDRNDKRLVKWTK